MDDGKVYNYTFLWSPDYLAVQKDGKIIQIEANSWVVP
jgi:hypothetical protein